MTIFNFEKFYATKAAGSLLKLGYTIIWGFALLVLFVVMQMLSSPIYTDSVLGVFLSIGFFVLIVCATIGITLIWRILIELIVVVFKIHEEMSRTAMAIEKLITRIDDQPPEA